MMRFDKKIWKEFKRILNKTSLIVAVAAPLAVAIFFSLLYKNEIARDLPIGFYDSDRSELSRTILRYLDASDYMRIDKEITSIQDIENEIQQGKLEAVFVIPINFEKDIKSGKSSTLVVYKNTSNIITGNMILKDANTVIRTVSGGAFAKKLKSKGINEEQALNIANSIKIDSHPLFNTHYSYALFLVPGLIFVTLQLAVMLSSVVPNTNKKNMSEFFVRLIPQVLLQYFNFIAVAFIILPLFDIHLDGNLNSIFIFFNLLIILSASISILISFISNNELFNTEVVLLLNTPAFLFCGLTYPLNLMPDIHIWFAQTIPFTHFFEAFIRIFYMDGKLSSAASEINILLGYLFIIFSITLIVVTIKSKKAKLLK